MKDIKKRGKSNPFIEVDEDFAIEVSTQSWNVWWRHKAATGKNKGEYIWTEEGYCRDLPAALRRIICIKSSYDAPTRSISAYLDWCGAQGHSLLDRVLRAEGELKKAIEHNKVMVNNNNFE
jgi:hypothetical protein